MYCLNTKNVQAESCTHLEAKGSQEPQGRQDTGSRGPEQQRVQAEKKEQSGQERGRRRHGGGRPAANSCQRRLDVGADGNKDGEAMAARPSSQFKGSGVGWRLIITPAVNI